MNARFRWRSISRPNSGLLGGIFTFKYSLGIKKVSIWSTECSSSQAVSAEYTGRFFRDISTPGREFTNSANLLSSLFVKSGFMKRFKNNKMIIYFEHSSRLSTGENYYPQWSRRDLYNLQFYLLARSCSVWLRMSWELSYDNHSQKFIVSFCSRLIYVLEFFPLQFESH